MARQKDNPWLGLASYQENQIIYGRNAEINDVSQCVLSNIDTVFYGKSGIGKSSIINAGVLPQLRAKGFLPIVIRLDHSNTHSYLRQIDDRIRTFVTVSQVSQCKSPQDELLWEYFHRNRFVDAQGQPLPLVLIFDQFEEIFTLQGNSAHKHAFFSQLSDVLNDIMPRALVDAGQPDAATAQPAGQPASQVQGFGNMAALFSSIAAQVATTTQSFVYDNNIHLVFILREDFLSEFEYHTSHIPTLKQHRYGLRPLNEEQAAEIIMQPRPGLISVDVAKLIIQTVTNRTDFSLGDAPEIDVDAAVLSLFLSRIYEKKGADADVITADLVTMFSKDIIRDFYEEAICDLTEAQVEFLEDELLTGEGRRDNMSRADIIAGGISPDVLQLLVEERKLLRQFHYEGDLRVEYIHDILCPVVRRRVSEREAKRQAEEERRRMQEEEQARLEEERQQRLLIEQQAQADRLAAQRRIRQFRVRLFSSLAVIAVLALVSWYLWMRPYAEYYADFTPQNGTGWPVGVGPALSQSQQSQSAQYYKLISRGRIERISLSRLFSHGVTRAPFYRVEAYAYGQPAVNRRHSLVALDVDSSEGQLLQQVHSWTYYQQNWTVGRVVAADIDDEIVYVESYFREVSTQDAEDGEDEAANVWVVYMDQYGRPFPITQSGISRMSISTTLTDQGQVLYKYRYFDESGTPQQGSDGTYGAILSYDASLRPLSRILLNAYGLPNAHQVNLRIYDYPAAQSQWSVCRNARLALGSLDIATAQPAADEHGVSRCVRTFTDTLRTEEYRDTADALLTTVPAIIERHYDRQGHLLSVVRRDAQQQLFRQGWCRQSHQYLPGTDVLSLTATYAVDEAGQEVESSSVRHEYQDGNPARPTRICYTRDPAHPAYPYYEIHYGYDGEGRRISSSCLGADGSKLLWPDQDYHRMAIDEHPIDAVSHYTVIRRYDPADVLVTTDSMTYSHSLLLTETSFGHDGDILYSYCYEYDDFGTLIAQSVMGYDGRPLRYAGWDRQGMCYYKLQRVLDFSGNLSYLTAVNEWGEESLCYFPGHTEGVSISRILASGQRGIAHYQRSQQLSIDVPADAQSYHFIRLTRSMSAVPADERVCDGDILLWADTSQVCVLRPDADLALGGRILQIPMPDASYWQAYPVLLTHAEAERIRILTANATVTNL